MILFVHLPKTAGNTLNRIAVSTGCACIVNDQAQLRSVSQEWDPACALPFVYIGGHFHLHFADELLAGFRIATPLVRATILRHPVDRAFSLYLFLLRVASAMPQHAAAIEGKDFAYF